MIHFSVLLNSWRTKVKYCAGRLVLAEVLATEHIHRTRGEICRHQVIRGHE